MAATVPTDSSQKVVCEAASKKAEWAVELVVFLSFSSGNMLNMKHYFNFNNSE